MPVSTAELVNRFTYHEPFGDQRQRYEAIRNRGLTLADFLVRTCPESHELSLALTNLDQLVFWANAAIARNESQGEK